MKIPVSEHQIMNQLKNYLEGNGWFVLRLNSGKLPMGEGRSRRMIQLLPAGTPDLMAFRKFKQKVGNAVLDIPLPELWFIEVKVGYNKPTLLQNHMMGIIEEHGARCIVVKSLEELQKLI